MHIFKGYKIVDVCQTYGTLKNSCKNTKQIYTVKYRETVINRKNKVFWVILFVVFEKVAYTFLKTTNNITQNSL